MTLRKVKGEGPLKCLKIGYIIDRKGIPRSARRETFVCKWGRKAGVSRAFLSSFLTPCAREATYSLPVRILGTRIRALCLVGIAKVEILLIRRTVPSTVLSQDSRDKGHMPIERTTRVTRSEKLSLREVVKRLTAYLRYFVTALKFYYFRII